jgi:hypothetical protein
MSTQPSFPADFHWGYATASAQVEGAVSAESSTSHSPQLEAGGRGASIWDTFSADPSHTDDGGSTKTATDFYHKYEEDIRMMKEYGGHDWPQHKLNPQGSTRIACRSAGAESFLPAPKAARSARKGSSSIGKCYSCCWTPGL